jgi:hypothetical protein
LANIIRRPIVVFAQHHLLGAQIPVHFQGIYLPFFSDPQTTDPTPIFIAYLGGDGVGSSNHFVPLVCQGWRCGIAPRIRLQVTIFV